MENLEQLLDKYVQLTLDIVSKQAQKEEIYAKIKQGQSSNGYKAVTEKSWTASAMEKYTPAQPEQQDDILALLHPEHGRTVKSLMTLTNRGHSYCYERLRRLLAAGKARVEVPRDCREPHRWFAI